jgi:hypothetical protein
MTALAEETGCQHDAVPIDGAISHGNAAMSVQVALRSLSRHCRRGGDAIGDFAQRDRADGGVGEVPVVEARVQDAVADLLERRAGYLMPQLDLEQGKARGRLRQEIRETDETRVR